MYLLSVELDVDPVSARVVRDEVCLELLLGEGVHVAGDPATVHHDLKVTEPCPLANN